MRQAGALYRQERMFEMTIETIAFILIVVFLAFLAVMFKTALGA
jgi:hypothetical protein